MADYRVCSSCGVPAYEGDKLCRSCGAVLPEESKDEGTTVLSPEHLSPQARKNENTYQQPSNAYGQQPTAVEEGTTILSENQIPQVGNTKNVYQQPSNAYSQQPAVADEGTTVLSENQIPQVGNPQNVYQQPNNAYGQQPGNAYSQQPVVADEGTTVLSENQIPPAAGSGGAYRQQPYGQPQYGQPGVFVAPPVAPVKDEVSVGLCILAFIIPIFGFIYGLSRKKEAPAASKKIITAACMGVIIAILVGIVSTGLRYGLKNMQKDPGNNVNASTSYSGTNEASDGAIASPTGQADTTRYDLISGEYISGDGTTSGSFESPVIVDNENIRLEFTDYIIYDDGDVELTCLVENKTTKNLNFKMQYLSTNGVMNDAYWYETVSAGIKSYSTFGWDCDNLIINGITYIQNVEGYLTVSDADDYSADDIYHDEFSLIINNNFKTGQPYTEIPAYSNWTEETIVDQGGLKLVVKGYTKDEDASGFFIYVENNTDEMISFTSDDESVNGIMCSSNWGVVVAPHKKAYSFIYWNNSTLEQNHIDNIDTCEMLLRIYNYDDWSIDDYYNATIKLNSTN